MSQIVCGLDPNRVIRFLQRCFVLDNDLDVLHRADDPVLDALSPESTITGSFKVVPGRLAE